MEFSTVEIGCACGRVNRCVISMRHLAAGEGGAWGGRGSCIFPVHWRCRTRVRYGGEGAGSAQRRLGSPPGSKSIAEAELLQLTRVDEGAQIYAHSVT